MRRGRSVFEKTVQLAPQWPDVYYNLGMVQEKAEKYSDAITNLKQYLRRAPNASDAETVKSLVNKLEFKAEQENGLRLVYEVMTYSTVISTIPHVRWVKISKKGDDQPDWEIEFHYYNPGSAMTFESRDRGIFIMKDGALHKSYYITQYTVMPQPLNFSIFPQVSPEEAVKVNGRFFEYRYPIVMMWVAEYADGHPILYQKSGGKLSIKGEIISVDPPRIKRTQQLKLPDGRIFVTEFVYVLQM